MRIKEILIFSSLLLVIGCSGSNTNRITEILEIPDSYNWILVIHSEGCKTCLDHLYQKLSNLEPANGSIVIVSKNSRILRLNPLFEQTSVPVYLDEEKKLIQEGILDLQDQILLFSNEGIEKFDIMDYESLLTRMGKL